MIIETLLNAMYYLVTGVLGFLPNVPSFPDSFNSSINTVLDTIFNNLDLLGCFVRPFTLQTIIPLAIILLQFDKIFGFIMWLVRKLPFFSIN